MANIVRCLINKLKITGENMSELNIMKFMINKFGTVPFRCSGECMIPWVHEGKVIIKKYNKEVKKGDIVLVYSDNFFKIHRVVKVENNTIITKGDFTVTYDSNNDKNNIIGYLYSIENIQLEYHHFIDLICELSCDIAELYANKPKGYIERISLNKEKILELSKKIVIGNGIKNNE